MRASGSPKGVACEGQVPGSARTQRRAPRCPPRHAQLPNRDIDGALAEATRDGPSWASVASAGLAAVVVMGSSGIAQAEEVQEVSRRQVYETANVVADTASVSRIIGQLDAFLPSVLKVREQIFDATKVSWRSWH